MCFANSANCTGYRNRLWEERAWECVDVVAASTWQTAHRTMLAKVMLGLVVPLLLEHTNIWQTQGRVKEVKSLWYVNVKINVLVKDLWATFQFYKAWYYYVLLREVPISCFYCSLFHLWQQYPDHGQTFYCPRLSFVNHSVGSSYQT